MAGYQNDERESILASLALNTTVNNIYIPSLSIPPSWKNHLFYGKNSHVYPIACTPPTAPAQPTLSLFNLSILQSTAEQTTTNQACSDPSRGKCLSCTQHSESQEMHVRMVSLLRQMRPPVPAVCGHLRQKDDKLWAKRILHDACTEECHLWILCK